MAAVGLDQITKWWAESALDNGRVINVLPTLEFDLSYNTGFSFGTGSGFGPCLLYTSPSPRDGLLSRMPSSA